MFHVNNDGLRAVDCAKKNGNASAVEFLEEKMFSSKVKERLTSELLFSTANLKYTREVDGLKLEVLEQSMKGLPLSIICQKKQSNTVTICSSNRRAY